MKKPIMEKILDEFEPELADIGFIPDGSEEFKPMYHPPRNERCVWLKHKKKYKTGCGKAFVLYEEKHLAVCPECGKLIDHIDYEIPDTSM